MKKKNYLEKRVKGIVCQVLNVDRRRLKPKCSIIDDLGVNSLSVLELELALEEEFDISFDMDGAENEIFTIRDLLAFVAAGGNQTVWLEYLQGRKDKNKQKSRMRSLNYSSFTERMISGGSY